MARHYHYGGKIMGIKKFARYLSGAVFCFVLYGGATIEAQNKTAAPSIMVYQSPT